MQIAVEVKISNRFSDLSLALKRPRFKFILEPRKRGKTWLSLMLSTNPLGKELDSKKL